MEKIPQHLAFLTVKEGEIQLKGLRELHQNMVGTLYKSIVEEQLIQVHMRLEELRKKERPRGMSVAHILESHYG